MQPKLSALFPEKFGGTVTNEDLYHAFNVVRPSLIRVEADEVRCATCLWRQICHTSYRNPVGQVTYAMHIVLRYELERGLMDGSVAVRLPRLSVDFNMNPLFLPPPPHRSRTCRCSGMRRWTNISGKSPRAMLR